MIPISCAVLLQFIVPLTNYRIFSIKRQGASFKTRRRRPGVIFLSGRLSFFVLNALGLLNYSTILHNISKAGTKYNRFRLYMYSIELKKGGIIGCT